MSFEYSSIVNTGLIVFGWAVVHFTARSRDRDKSRRELVVKAVDLVSEQIGKIVIAAVSYHTSDTRDVAREIELKISLKDLSNQIRLLDYATKPRRDGVRSSMLHKIFKQSISAKHFEDEHTCCLLSGDPQFNEIAAAGLEIKTYFAEIKFAQFD
jgi:hypothetical protein